MHIRFLRRSVVALIISSLALAPAALRAEDVTPAIPSTVSPVGPAAPASGLAASEPAASEQTAGPRLQVDRAGISTVSAVSATSRAEATPDAAATGVAAQNVGTGRNTALMIVGAAGIVTGAVVGGGAGAAIAVAGAAVGLYGLYQFLR